MTAQVLPLNREDQHSDKPVLVPDGEYTVAYLHHKTWLFKGKYPKVTISFAIQDYGEFHLRQINAYYNARKLKGKPSKNGHFSIGWKSDLMLDYSTLFGSPERNDRISMCRFKNCLIQVRTRVVKRNREQREYPEGMQYSVVDRLLKVIER